MQQLILIVEDEAHIADGLRYNIEAEGYETEVRGDGKAALEFFFEEKREADLIVLDVMLPHYDGFAITRKLREAEIYTPILMLTARDRPEDILLGFESGTDDYLPKPFELSIFMARLNGLLRRGDWNRQIEEPVEETAYIVNGRNLDLENLELDVDGETVRITLMESKLLRHMIQNAGRAVSRKEILEEVWDLSQETDTRAIDNFIVRLRRYLEDDPQNPIIVETVRGIGYKLNLD